MGALLTTLLALPVLGLISLPLIISAWITVVFALFTLFVRLSVIYFELLYEFTISFFTLPLVNSSLLTFVPSEPPTPAAGNSRRNSAYGLIRSRKSQDSLSSWSIIEAQDEPSKKSKKSYARIMAEAHHLPTGFGLPVSGDERRDFEGVGGWRSCPDRPRSNNGLKSTHENPTNSMGSPSDPSATGDANSDMIDEDESAWLSLNNRLELPSQSTKLFRPRCVTVSVETGSVYDTAALFYIAAIKDHASL
ncbi:hypothetical protein PENSTE_c012G08060 [Penicillium steckii]|uniref:Uncharacterized protein n=1 Tax=Penicillium steckii TaxID=303698 RepID=A0A1V6T5P9_9EURO|nr:hypothetical protein PENSTE_c012G08060 [Penicillium steckii]